MLSFAWEPLAALLDDGIADLVRSHWEEVSDHKETRPLSVDWDGYLKDEKSGVFRCLGARLDDRLIGYNSFYVLKHRHYDQTWHALSDAIYVAAEQRHTGAGVRLIRLAEQTFKREYGECLVIYHDKSGLRLLGPVLDRLGYTLRENIWDKWVS